MSLFPSLLFSSLSLSLSLSSRRRLSVAGTSREETDPCWGHTDGRDGRITSVTEVQWEEGGISGNVCASSVVMHDSFVILHISSVALANV